jgi:DNA-binding CsgD family transcriptional regulator
MSETEIARGYGLTRTQLQAAKSIAISQQKQEKIRQAERLGAKGLSNSAIGEKMGLNESSVRALRAPGAKAKAEVLEATADMLRRQVEEKGAIDIGTAVEKALPLSENPAQLVGISDTKFKTAVVKLQEEGYKVHYVNVNTGPAQFTKMKALSRSDIKWVDLIRNPSLIKTIAEHSVDGGKIWDTLKRPLSILSRRIEVVYAEEGGATKDGLIEIRPGAKNLDMGKSNYAQVRIAVDGTHYLKGMAIYNPDLPTNVDIRFNTNKSRKSAPNKLDAMKAMEKTPDGKIDLDNPFTSQIKPGGQRGALNIINEAGDWDKHSKSLPSQMLAKQSPKLAKTQLNLTHERRRKELDSILELTNPTVKKKLLETFADETDSAATHLKAAARVGQTTKVLIPIPSMKPHEVYAPSLRNGTRVALVRFPHGGTFEIPEVTVNNRNPEAKKILGNRTIDAIGINHKVAERLSGADFDGDDVLVIPNDRGEVKSSPSLQGLKNFDPRATHAPYDGMPTIDGGTYRSATKTVDYHGKAPNGALMQQEMGYVSNLITDMTIRGADSQEKARAVRHSMVVIDAEKHSLDYKGSKRDNGIAQLHLKYQGKATGGAKTLISRASGAEYINVRKPRPAKDGGPIDRATGKKVYVETGEKYIDKKTGKEVVRTYKTKKLAVTDDAHTLSSGTDIERVYADHSNRMKATANEARKAMINTQPDRVSKSAKKAYAKDVESLDSKLNLARMNAPRERQAQAVANAIVSQKRQARPNMDDDNIKKVRRQALAEARSRTGAKKDSIDLTQTEWDAIQAAAISDHKLKQILNNTDIDTVRKLATPRQKLVMTSSKSARAQSMLSQGYTQAEVADALGVALSTLKLSLSG